jgi:LysM repeat protein
LPYNKRAFIKHNFFLKNMRLGKKILFLSIFFFAALFFADRAGAINTGTVGILPGNPDPTVPHSASWFVYNLDLGRSKTDSVRVINNKPETVVVKLYAVDATTTSDGSFALLPEDAPRTDVGSWVQLAANEIEIPANSEKTVPFTITVPDEADVGDHMGGLVMQEVEGANSMSGTGVKIVTRVGVRIYETVPGEVKKDFEITKFEWRTDQKRTGNFLKDILDINRRTAFIFGLKNKGNVKITPKATIEVWNIFGKKVADLRDKEIGILFPRKENEGETIYWDGMPFFGRYKVRLTTTFSEDGVGTGSKDIVIWAFPYRIIFILVLMGVLSYLIRLTMLYFREAKKEKMPIYTVRDGETLGILAQKFGVSWKNLAKLNEIKKPFEVRPSQKLFIPYNKRNIDHLVKMVETGQLDPPFKGEGKAGRRKRKIIIAIVVLAILAGAFLWYKYKQKAAPNSSQPASANQEATPQESQEKTAAGAVKKSSVKIGIFTSPETDPVSSTRLLRKLRLIGYNAEIIPDLAGRQYQDTTIEYASGKKDQAEMLKSDLGTSVGAALQEIDGLAKDLVVYNLIRKENLPELGAGSEEAVPRRDLVKIKILDGGGGRDSAEKVKTLVYVGGFSPEENIGDAQNKDNKGIIVIYSDDIQKENADVLASFLQDSKYQVTIEKGQGGEDADILELIVGK